MKLNLKTAITRAALALVVGISLTACQGSLQSQIQQKQEHLEELRQQLKD
jgi:hypothetical protein